MREYGASSDFLYQLSRQPYKSNYPKFSDWVRQTFGLQNTAGQSMSGS